MKKRRVVITGLGVVAPNGIGKDEFWQACISGKSGVDYITSFDTSNLNSKIAAQVKNFDPLNYMSSQVAKRTDRFVHFGIASARMALEDSGLDLERENRDRIGVVIGSGLGGVIFHEVQMMMGLRSLVNKINPSSVPRITPNAVSSQVAIEFNINGSNIAIANACASGTNAIGQAVRLIQYNEVDIVLAGGVEAPITAVTFGGYHSLNVLSKRNDSPQEASRPFDRERDGFVIGEGGAILILEELSHAIKRNAYIYGEIIGYATNSGAYHMVMPEPDGKDAARVTISALKDADITPEDVDYINAHGTSTQAGDKAETMTIKQVFKELAYNIPISSTKSMIGHTIGAAGAIEAVVCILAIENNVIPPTINYKYPDPECDLDYVPNQARRTRVDTVLSNSFGFGNNNACIILRRYKNDKLSH